MALLPDNLVVEMSPVVDKTFTEPRRLPQFETHPPSETAVLQNEYYRISQEVGWWCCSIGHRMMATCTRIVDVEKAYLSKSEVGAELCNRRSSLSLA